MHTQRSKILPEFEHVDHVKVDDIKNFHRLIITHRAEKRTLRTHRNTLDHTYTPETNAARLFTHNIFIHFLKEKHTTTMLD